MSGTSKRINDLNSDEQEALTEYAKDAGYRIPRARKELIVKGLKAEGYL